MRKIVCVTCGADAEPQHVCPKTGSWQPKTTVIVEPEPSQQEHQPLSGQLGQLSGRCECHDCTQFRAYQSGYRR